jgi:hypothetical protein
MDIPNPWRLVNTPEPDLLGFRTFHDPDTLVFKTADGNDGWPIEGTTVYGNWFGALGAYTKSALPWGNYVLTDEEITDEGIVAFTWHKNKTVAEANVPFRSHWAEFGDKHWPAILKALTLQQDDQFVAATPTISGSNQGIAIAPRYYQQEEYINDVDEGTRFLLQEFFGPREFIIPKYPTPQPGRVSYQTATREGSFPECLHDDITIPSTRTSISQNAGGTTTEAAGALEGQFFPKTAFKTWRPYVKKSTQVRRDGGWYRTIVRVYPPRIPRRIRRDS